VSAPAPFQIVSGSSFSLLPGQPQEVVVRFSSATAGSFSKSVTISSNGGSKAVTATGIAHKVSFSPAQLDFGSGLLVLREQCDNKMGTCRLGTEKLGLPIEKVLMVKNEGSVAVSLTLSTAAPYKIVSVLPTLSPGQSGQVTLRFDPSESGSFTGTVQVGINGGQGSVSSPPLVGTAHKIEIDPAELDFGVVIVDPESGLHNYSDQKFTVKNQGVTTVTLEAPVRALNEASPFQAILETSPAILEPGASIGLGARFSPTHPGIYTGYVDLMFGSVIEGISAWGLAYAPLEASQHSNMTMLDQYNWALAQEGVEGGVLYAEDFIEGTKLLLTGFYNVTLEQVQFLLRVAAPLSQGLQGSQSTFCSLLEQQPDPLLWITLAREFLNSNPNWQGTYQAWDEAARKIGSLGALGRYGQETFNLYVAALVLAVKSGLDNPVLWGTSLAQAQQRANQILQYKLLYVLNNIKNTNDRTTAENWAAILRVAANTILNERGDGSHWVLLDFMRTLDSNGNEVLWSSSSPPTSASIMIEVVAWRPFVADPTRNGTLLAFLKVDTQGAFFPLPYPKSIDEKAKNMVSWVNKVYQHISNNVVSGAAFYWHGMKVVGWIFINPQLGGSMKILMDNLSTELEKLVKQNNWPGLPYPFFVAYSSDGQPQVVCFGCNNRNEILAVWMAACQLGGICAGDVTIYKIGGGTASATDDYNMVFPDPGEGGASMPIGELFFLDRDGGGGGGDAPPECE
jgi:hypothetical protein